MTMTFCATFYKALTKHKHLVCVTSAPPMFCSHRNLLNIINSFIKMGHGDVMYAYLDQSPRINRRNAFVYVTLIIKGHGFCNNVGL